MVSLVGLPTEGSCLVLNVKSYNNYKRQMPDHNTVNARMYELSG